MRIVLPLSMRLRLQFSNDISNRVNNYVVGTVMTSVLRVFPFRTKGFRYCLKNKYF